jgi:hypothetical protein
VFELNGNLSSSDLFGQAGQTPTTPRATNFTFRAVFDDERTTYQAGPPGAPLPGYVAYGFQSATFTIGELTYDVAAFGDDPVGGVTVALFDPTNVFNPGFYGIGFFGNPLSVGPGIIARFENGPAGFTANDPTAGEFSGFLGYGALSGPTIDPGPGNVCFGDPSLCAVTPISLTRDGQQFELTLASAAYDAENLNGAFSAKLVGAVPEPATWAMMLLGFFGIGGLMRSSARGVAGSRGEGLTPA